MIQVNFQRTLSKNYQSMTFGIQFGYDEKETGILLSQARALAFFLVKSQITETWTIDEVVQHQDAYKAIFMEPIEAYLAPIAAGRRQLNGSERG